MTGTSESKIIIRDIGPGVDMHAVEELQREVWGVPDLDVVPAAQFIASVAAGGVLMGAFEGDVLTGFVFGFVGYEDGAAIHHSHMLAVKPGFRSFNLGHRLKLGQRERVIDQGISKITWTFDPLQSLNAHINFRKLGVVSNRYLIDFYGEDAASFLHRNSTDRLWVTWLLSSKRVTNRVEGAIPEIEFENLEKLVEVGDDDQPRVRETSEVVSNERVVIEIPTDINSLQQHDAELAIRWREATRRAFTDSVGAGYLVEDFCRGSRDGSRNGGYVLSRDLRLDEIS